MLVTSVESLFNWARLSSFWQMSFGLACCAIEMMATSASHYDMMRFGVIPRPSPRQSDVIIISGTVTLKMATRIKMLYEQMADPKETLQEALERVRGWKLAEWHTQREALGDQIGWLVGGLDSARFGKVRDAVIDLLARTRSMKESDYEAKRGELEREAEQIVGQIGPTEVLRNFTEHALEEMLSNPRLEASLKARAKGD